MRTTTKYIVELRTGTTDKYDVVIKTGGDITRYAATYLDLHTATLFANAENLLKMLKQQDILSKTAQKLIRKVEQPKAIKPAPLPFEATEKEKCENRQKQMQAVLRNIKKMTQKRS